MATPIISLFDPAEHDRQGFSCGEPTLDAYIQTQATKDVRRRAAALYVLEGQEGQAIRGYYTLSACSVQLAGISPGTQKKLARYPEVAGILIGRLAVDEHFKGAGLGAALLRDALRRCLHQSADLGVAAVVVDALNAEAQRFYEHYGFRAFGGAGSRLYLPVATIQQSV